MENNKGKRYPKEIRDKAVRMIGEHSSEYPSQWACVISIAEKLGMTPETLRKWVKLAVSSKCSWYRRSTALVPRVNKSWYR